MQPNDDNETLMPISINVD